MPGVEIRTLKEVDLKGGTIVAAFPSVGLVSTISTTYLIQMLPVDQVCALESEDFPSVSMIYAKKPKFPARVYASPGHKLAIFICEMPLPTRIHRPVAYALMDWAKKEGIRRIISLEGLPMDGDGPRTEEPNVWGVGSTDAARKQLDTHEIPQLETGMIAGVAGVLLNEGRWRNVDVIALLAEARQDLPDAHAAVSLVHALDELLEDVTVDLGPLQQQARQLEEYLQRLKQQAAPATPKEGTPPSDMYR
ncbi:MAG TPA: proteasome assembly chaperone family protein [Thermoplasmata archaeon]|nr:proteasome assembly chaperone family protein [Thermoplasmata archaeon]